MNFIYLSPEFPPNYFNFVVALKKAGATVLGIGETPYNMIRQELKDALTEYFFLPNMMDYDQLLRAVAYFTHKYGKIDRIDSNNEHWLGIESWLRDDFNVFGQRRVDTDINRSKLEMKKVYNEAGIPTSKGVGCDTLETVEAFVDENDYPFVLKPARGVGALGTFKVENDEELSDVLQKLPDGYMMEETLTGDLQSYDGLVDRDGNIFFEISHQYSSGVMEIVNEQRQMHYFSFRDFPEGLVEIGRKTVEAFHIRERFFHAEFFRKDGEYYALEVNVRPPGGFTTDMMNFSCDFDIYQIWANMLVNGDTTLDYERKYHVAHASRRSRTSYKHTHDEVLEKFGDRIAVDMEVPFAFSTAMGNYVYMVRHEELEAVFEAIRFIQELA